MKQLLLALANIVMLLIFEKREQIQYLEFYSPDVYIYF